MGVRRAQALAWGLLGETLLLRGQWDEAASCLRRSVELHQALAAKTGETLAWQRLGELAVYRGNAAAAQECIQRGLALAAETSMAAHLMGRLYATMALNALDESDPATAAQAIEAAKAAAAHYGDCPTCSALFHPVAAEAYALIGDREKAAEHARAAEEVASCWESGAWHAMAQVARAMVATGEEAAERFSVAAELFERLGQPFQTGRCLLQAGRALGARGKVRAARRALQRALAILETLGAVRVAGQVRRELAELPNRSATLAEDG